MVVLLRWFSNGRVIWKFGNVFVEAIAPLPWPAGGHALTGIREMPNQSLRILPTCVLTSVTRSGFWVMDVSAIKVDWFINCHFPEYEEPLTVHTKAMGRRGPESNGYSPALLFLLFLFSFNMKVLRYFLFSLASVLLSYVVAKLICTVRHAALLHCRCLRPSFHLHHSTDLQRRNPRPRQQRQHVHTNQTRLYRRVCASLIDMRVWRRVIGSYGLIWG